jgi:UDP-GlcNAc:undecaprenyl-phosphate GlcNAc-1-phosphate transferase
MRTLVILAFTFTAALSWALTELVRRLALRRRLVDRNEGRGTVGYRPVPRLGGVAIAASFAAATLLLVALVGGGAALPRGHVATDPFVWAIACAVLALGVVDDLRSLPAALKLAALVATGALMAAHGHRVDHVPGIARPLDGAAATALTIAWYAGVGTAWNFIDGLDGLAAGLAAVAALTFWLLSWPADPVVPVLLVGAVVGFLAHNRHPSVIFMGDGGSFFVGFWMATLGLAPADSGSSLRGSLVVIGAFAWPLADLVWAMSARLRRYAPFRASADHLHYVLHRRIGHRSAVLCILIVAGGAASLALALGCDLTAGTEMLVCLGALWLFAGRVRVARPVAFAAMYLVWLVRTMLPTTDAPRRAERQQQSAGLLASSEGERGSAGPV